MRSYGKVMAISLLLLCSEANSMASYRLPSLSELKQRDAPDQQLDAYRLRGNKLVCNLPDRTPVTAVLVTDPADFAFMAARSPHGPVILANERFIKNRPHDYAVFSFFRECGLHAIHDVQATGPDDSSLYDADIGQLAECLAVIPTQEALGPRKKLFWNGIVSALKNEYGERATSSAAELQRCSQPDYVKSLTRRIRVPRRN